MITYLISEIKICVPAQLRKLKYWFSWYAGLLTWMIPVTKFF